MTKNIDYHHLSQWVAATISSLNSESFSREDIEKNLRFIEEKIISLKKDDDKLFEAIDINLFLEAKHYMLNHIDAMYTVEIIKSDNIVIKFSRRYFFSILQNLIYNAREAAEKLGFQTFEMHIFFSKVSEIELGKTVVYIHARDNIGSFDNFKKIIDDINNADEINNNLLNNAKGNRLRTIKRMVDLDSIPWRLIYDDKSNTKELIIPLSAKNISRVR